MKLPRRKKPANLLDTFGALVVAGVIRQSQYSVVEHRRAESEGLRFDTSWGLIYIMANVNGNQKKKNHTNNP